MGLVIVIEPHGTYAIYEQIVNQIKNQIISGELQPDEALPSIRAGVPRPPVWVESTTVGSATGWKPMTDSTGRITARLHRPTPDRSWMQRIFFGSTGFCK